MLWTPKSESALPDVRLRYRFDRLPEQFRGLRDPMRLHSDPLATLPIECKCNSAKHPTFLQAETGSHTNLRRGSAVRSTDIATDDRPGAARCAVSTGRAATSCLPYSGHASHSSDRDGSMGPRVRDSLIGLPAPLTPHLLFRGGVRGVGGRVHGRRTPRDLPTPGMRLRRSRVQGCHS